MRHTSRISCIAAVLALGGCASMFEGSSQHIEVVTNPPGAACVLEREGEQIASLPQTPGIVRIKKNKHDIMVKCTKPGYAEGSFLNESGTAAVAFANVLWGVFMGPVAIATDAVTGADNKYDGTVTITLTANAAPAEPPPAPPAPITMKPVAD